MNLPKALITVGFLFSGAVAWAQEADRGLAVYKQTCLACHQVDGSGVPQLTPSLIGSTFIATDKSRLINIVLKGLKNVEVDGEMYDNPMPPFASLSDEDIAAVLTYVRNHFTNNAGPIKKEEVTAQRQIK